MTSILNVPACQAAGAGNTGVPPCYFEPKNIVGAIIVHPTKAYTAAQVTDLATFKAALLADALVVGNGRIFPVFRFNAITDNSEDATVQTTGYGEKSISREGDYDWTFQYFDGGACLNANLRKFNDLKYKVFFVDRDNNIFGTKNSSGDFVGITTSFIFTHKWKVNDGTNSTTYRIQFSLPKPEEINDAGKLAFVAANFDFETEIKGLLDLEVYQISLAFGVATVGVRLNCGKTDLHATYATELADTNLWVVTDANGATVVISSVTDNPTAGGWDIAFTGTGTHYINLAAPATLAAAGVGGAPDNGYEGIQLTVSMPLT